MAGWSLPGTGATMRCGSIRMSLYSQPIAATRSVQRSRIEKRPALRLKQGAFALVGEHGAVLKRGDELAPVLAPLERRLMRLVG